jgi:hypothetical protein
MKLENQLRHLTKIGIKDFETPSDAEHIQKDMLRRFERSSLDPGRYWGLTDCRSNYCAYKNCQEACWFGTRRRRLKEISAIYRLLKEVDGPLHEVRLIRGSWALPFGNLRDTNIGVAKSWNARALDKIFVRALVAAGILKPYVAPEDRGRVWICELHQIIAGAEKADLEKALSRGRQQDVLAIQRLSVREVSDLGETISRVFQRDLERWQDPWPCNIVSPNPEKPQRCEFYEWLLELRPGARLIRYGCDQYFNKLAKKPRTFRATVRKKRKYPYHLKRYMFGYREGIDVIAMTPQEREDIMDPCNPLASLSERRPSKL